MSLIHADAKVHELEAGLSEEDFSTDPHEGESLAWLLPIAVTAISVIVLSACRYFGWLM